MSRAGTTEKEDLEGSRRGGGVSDLVFGARELDTANPHPHLISNGPMMDSATHPDSFKLAR